MKASPVVTRVSQATRPVGSSRMTASRTASEIWSAILSGCPSVTDSEVKKCLSVLQHAIDSLRRIGGPSETAKPSISRPEASKASRRNRRRYARRPAGSRGTSPGTGAGRLSDASCCTPGLLPARAARPAPSSSARIGVHGVRGIGENQIEALGSGEPARGWPPRRGPTRSGSLLPAPARAARGPGDRASVRLDEHRRAAPARNGLESDGAGAGEELEDPRPRDRSAEQVEERGPRPAGRRPGAGRHVEHAGPSIVPRRMRTEPGPEARPLTAGDRERKSGSAALRS